MSHDDIYLNLEFFNGTNLIFPKILCKGGGQSVKRTILYATLYAIDYACTNSARSLAEKTKKFCACKDQRLPGRRGPIRTAGSGPRPVTGAHVARVLH